MEGLVGEGIRKVFPGGTVALDGVSFCARRGRVLTLLGPSGCGKTTLLRVIAGLETPTSGSLGLDGRPLLSVPPGGRDVGFVFQNYALYPHLTVEENLTLCLAARRVPRAERIERVRETVSRLDIEELVDRRPAALSGGQQQRVALGRALIRRPRLLLLDEPLSNLDAILREAMRAELKSLFRTLDATVVYVTHDQTEAMSLSGEVAVMRAGRIEQCDTPEAVYRRPGTLFVATFVGSPRMTVWRGKREGNRLMCAGAPLPIPSGLAQASELIAGIRPEDVLVSASPLSDGWEASLDLVEPLGPRSLLTVRIGDERLRVLAEPKDWAARLWVRWPPERTHWFDARSEGRLEPKPA